MRDGVVRALRIRRCPTLAVKTALKAAPCALAKRVKPSVLSDTKKGWKSAGSPPSLSLRMGLVAPFPVKTGSGYLRRRTANARTPEPKSRAPAGKSTDGDGPPLFGRSSSIIVCSIIIVSSLIIVSCAIAAGTRISMATRAAVASKITLFKSFPFLLHGLSLHGLHSFLSQRSYP